METVRPWCGEPSDRERLIFKEQNRTGMAAAPLLRMHDRGIRHHFRGNPAYFTSVTADFPRYYSCPHYRTGLTST